jgi:DNA replication licensing factor MCM4
VWLFNLFANLSLSQVNVQDAMTRFRTFVLTFNLGGDDDDEEEDDGDEEDGKESKRRLGLYARALQGIHVTQELNLAVNCEHLATFPTCRKLYNQLVQYPQEIVPVMDLVVHQLFLELHPQDKSPEQTEADLGGRRIQARPYNLQDVHQLRQLDPSNIDQLVAITGMVTRVSPVIPDLKQGFFKCALCGDTAEVMIDRGRIDEPTSCPNCRNKFCMEMVHNRCLFMDKQMVRLQETPDEIPEGETPQAVVLFSFEDLVDAVRPGDRVEVTGIFRAIPKRVNPKMRTLRSVYKTHVDVIHYRLVAREEQASNPSDDGTDSDEVKKVKGGKGMEDDNIDDDDDEERNVGSGNGSDDDHEFAFSSSSSSSSSSAASSLRKLKRPDPRARGQYSAQRLAAMANLANDPEVYKCLTDSLAPGIWELDDVKKGVLCQLFGGAQGAYDEHSASGGNSNNSNNGPSAKRGDSGGEDGGDDDDDGSTSHKARGEINVLLCGDPGTSKSQILSYVHKLAPRGVYTSGKGSSAVGLTASVVRDPETKDLVLESGALVLSDLGVCCIDEFDKMSDTTRAILHEAMEQQTISIAKAGIICTLNARTSILASANPTESRYNPRLSVVENIQLSPTLLSRFDLIYLILDKPNADSDRRLAKHLVSLYFKAEDQAPPSKRLADQSLLRDYIAYCRRFVHPTISDDAERELIEGYLEMRRMGSSAKTITATPRQLESLIRLSEARARMEWRTVVERRDVVEAIRLMRVATQTAATDPRTGTIDMDMITTGTSSVDRTSLAQLAGELKNLLSASQQGEQQQRVHLVDLRKRIEEQNSVQVGLDELRQAVEVLQEEGFVSYVEGTQMVVVRG